MRMRERSLVDINDELFCHFFRLSANTIHRRGLKDSEKKTSEEYNRPVSRRSDEATQRQDTPEVIPKYVAVVFFFLTIGLASFMLFRYIEFSIEQQHAS